MAIIHKGGIIAQGSIEELRAGVEARAAAAGGLLAPHEEDEKLTLEQIFLEIVGGAKDSAQELSWLA